MTATVLTFISGGLGGSLITLVCNALRNRLQVMECHYLEDDVLSKIPQKHEDNMVHQNVHCKRFRVKNTTNKDIPEFKILFQFDSTADLLDCYSRSKEGYNRQRIRKNRGNNNEAEALVKNFNRGDSIEYVFQIANVSDNKYYVTECSCIGFKIRCKDKRKAVDKSKSNQSDQILVVKR
ncbi:hypothetical protein [uncultured Alistipes sp.]|uniref:hypothetical protein n=1 Tax=uncultured Alistipes sp. TaxID=538949 RepID=UPI002729DF61|nr:hypothetical protein [uncultured Alistipes sp.]